MSKRSHQHHPCHADKSPKRKYSRQVSSHVVVRNLSTVSEEEKENSHPSDIQKLCTRQRSLVEEKFNIGGNVTLGDLPHPSTLCGKKHKVRKTCRRRYSIVESYLQQLKRKQTEFHWVPEIDEDSNNSNLQDSLESRANFLTHRGSSFHVLPSSTHLTNENKNLLMKSQGVETDHFMVRSSEVIRSGSNSENQTPKGSISGYSLMSRMCVNNSPVLPSNSFDQKVPMIINHNKIELSSIPTCFLTTGEITRASLVDKPQKPVWKYPDVGCESHSNNTEIFSTNQIDDMQGMTNEITSQCSSFMPYYNITTDNHSEMSLTNTSEQTYQPTVYSSAELPADLAELSTVVSSWKTFQKEYRTNEDLTFPHLFEE